MIYLFFSLLFVEMVTILLLLFKTPLRKLLIIGIDRMKRGRAPLVVKSVGATVFVIMMYNVYSVTEIQSRPPDALNPTDQIILAYHMLEASLMGFSLFLSLMVDRLHHYIRELRILRKTVEAAKKQNRAAEDVKNKGADEVKILNEETSRLQSEIKRLQSEYETKVKEVKSAEANSIALKNQSEGFLLEYDRLLAENQNLRDQLRSIDECLSHSNGKKDT
ncbi:B-cell receptor-associated protein 31-like [Cynara cardunculus var. scolymus]|uniref:Endoplasmic reticulum transmembrane protein n=1 Tax=Cynara cardunculus var. scolymus TaxID=59895 RepID=A0A103XE39_CYNCS|nr:B-cell receptor-associated protein 31-like [Cynara cardunculus var. scolymus]KVH88983.1 B-cell receptor-associated 31-like protein [Cynara cardunculus var. scolymus]